MGCKREKGDRWGERRREKEDLDGGVSRILGEATGFAGGGDTTYIDVKPPMPPAVDVQLIRQIARREQRFVQHRRHKNRKRIVIPKPRDLDRHLHPFGLSFSFDSGPHILLLSCPGNIFITA